MENWIDIYKINYEEFKKVDFLNAFDAILLIIGVKFESELGLLLKANYQYRQQRTEMLAIVDDDEIFWPVYEAKDLIIPFTNDIRLRTYINKKNSKPELKKLIINFSDLCNTIIKIEKLLFNPSIDAQSEDCYKIKIRILELIKWSIEHDVHVDEKLKSMYSIIDNTALPSNDHDIKDIEKKATSPRNKKRANQLHCLIWKVYLYLIDNKKELRAQNVWNEIRHRYKNHDEEKIIHFADERVIKWISYRGNGMELKRESFDSTLSKIVNKGEPYGCEDEDN